MPVPIGHIQVRFYADETYSVDYYGDPTQAEFLDSFKTAFCEQAKPLADAKHSPFRATPFYFSGCSGCQQLILTNRDKGHPIVCCKCRHSGTTHDINDPHLKPLLKRIEVTVVEAR